MSVGTGMSSMFPCEHVRMNSVYAWTVESQPVVCVCACVCVSMHVYVYILYYGHRACTSGLNVKCVHRIVLHMRVRFVMPVWAVIVSQIQCLVCIFVCACVDLDVCSAQVHCMCVGTGTLWVTCVLCTAVYCVWVASVEVQLLHEPYLVLMLWPLSWGLK